MIYKISSVIYKTRLMTRNFDNSTLLIYTKIYPSNFLLLRENPLRTACDYGRDSFRMLPVCFNGDNSYIGRQNTPTTSRQLNVCEIWIYLSSNFSRQKPF